MNKLEIKARKLLGNRFHLCTSYDENFEIKEWHLYRNYDDSKVYFSSDNEEIMSNETNTLEELYEFAKKHHQIDEHFTIGKMNIFIAWLLMILTIINIIFIKNETLRGFIYGGDFMIILYSIVAHRIYIKNSDVRMLELKEYFIRHEKERKGE